MSRWRQIAVAAALCLGPGTGLAQDRPDLTALEPGRAYEACTALVNRDPAAAFEAAIAWRDIAGGLSARHCVALALAALEKFDEAGRRLEQLAADMTAFPANTRAEVLAQAGRAWLLADEPERAYAAVTTGLDSNPTNVELLIDRSEILAEAGSFWDALDDLNRALDLAPDRVDALIFRAAAYRLVEAPELAAEDIDRALVLAPGHPEALVERGMLRRLGGDDDGARADWLEVLRAAPDSFAAQVAQANLQRLELGLQ